MRVTEPTSRNPAPAWWRRPRWRLAAAAFLLGATYTAVAMAIGAELRLGGRDLTLLGGAVVEVTFALFGYFLGFVVEARRRERQAAGEREAHLEALADARHRLAQAEKLASLGQLAGAVAHEVRNPLAILRSMVQNLDESLATRAEGSDARATCQALVEEIDRLAHVTSSLVDFARPPTLVRAPVRVSELLARLRPLAEQLLDARPVGLEIVVGTGVGVIDGDADLLCQVLLGLLENAAESAPAGSTVAVRVACRDGEATIDVIDRGPGVPPALRDRVFDPFFTTRDGGTGLGLAVARHLVEAHGGRIAVDDAPAGGARFRVHVPAAGTTVSEDAA